jgi:cytoskeletal protein RodZ
MGTSIVSLLVILIVYLAVLALGVGVLFLIIKNAVISALRFSADELAESVQSVNHAASHPSAEARLRELADLKERDLITATEYETQRAAVIGDV